MKFTVTSIIGIALSLTSVASACGCGCKDHPKKDAAAEVKTEEAAEAEAAPAKEIVITGNDTMQFDQAALELTAGEATKITFKNVGNLPKAAMGHNFVILKPGSDILKFGMAAASAAATEYIPQDEAGTAMLEAHTKLLGPGEEDSIVVTLEAGEYPFLCSFPGHYAMMKGVITVK